MAASVGSEDLAFLDSLPRSSQVRKEGSFALKDSGERHEFASGMRRDVSTDKVLWHLVADGPMLGRWAEHLTKGNRKYDLDRKPGEAPNWMKAEGIEELERFRESAVRHFMQWLYGRRDEDHAAAVFFNLNGFEYTLGRMNGDGLSSCVYSL